MGVNWNLLANGLCHVSEGKRDIFWANKSEFIFALLKKRRRKKTVLSNILQHQTLLASTGALKKDATKKDEMQNRCNAHIAELVPMSAGRSFWPGSKKWSVTMWAAALFHPKIDSAPRRGLPSEGRDRNFQQQQGRVTTRSICFHVGFPKF